VRKRILYFVGQWTAFLLWVVAIALLPTGYNGTPQGPPPAGELLGVLLLTALAAVVAHELGHLLACLALGAKVKEFRLGHDRYAIRFRVRTVQVWLGLPYRGRVLHEGARSVGRRAAITLAGSLADLALAGLALIISATAASGQPARALAVAVALGFAVVGLGGLMPYRSRSKRLSDGARLLELRSDTRTAQLRAIQNRAARLAQTGRAEELLQLHAGLGDPSDRANTPQAVIRALIETNVAFLAGLPDDAAQLAARRLEMLMSRRDLGPAEATAHLALALLLLRQAGQDGYAAAEQHCARALALKGSPGSVRPAALGAIIVSRQARGLPYEDVLATAAATQPALDYPVDTTAAHLKAIVHPEATLRAFRAGDPGARVGAAPIAVLLRRQGRVSDLLDLHAGLGAPEGGYSRDEAESVHAVEDSLLLVPGLPPAVVNEAAIRAQWLADNYPFNGKENPKNRAAIQHTLAVARLRQGRFAEVEPLCGPGLADDHGPDGRASILATVVLARRALGQPHADLLAEAVALSAGADLVVEARSGAESAAPV
jgi:hypothetical protein